ncbi:hypothetical protein pb186bvf_002137 [Paramecium bursaria]
MQVKCVRNGCKKPYAQEENNDQACKYHPGKPIFHDLKKGWTCCNVIVYDWDEFQKLPTCAVGQHTSQAEEQQQGFFQSSTVQNAQNGLQKFAEQPQQVKNINDYNKEQEAKQKEQQPTEKKPFLTPNGKYKCANKGCLKEYDQNIPDQVCNHHPGEPIFHDLKKYWTCCKVEKYDWDEFMKLPTCKQGQHNPKMI